MYIKFRTTFKYTQHRKIWKPDNLKFGSNKSKRTNRKAKIGYGHLRLREESLSFINNYII